MKTLTIDRVLRSLKRRVRYNLYPRAVLWKYWQRNCPGKPIITKLDRGLMVRVYPHDVIGKYIYIDGVFEADCWNFVKKFLQQGMVFFDAGANLGQYTLLAAQRVGMEGQVHSFEPCSRMFAELKFNVKLNDLSEICVLNKVALSDKVGTAKLSRYEAGEEVYGSLGAHSAQQRGNKPNIGYEVVETTKLDTYVKEKCIDYIDLIKMDIEGAELLALQGAVQILSNEKAPAIVLELADINTVGFGYQAVDIWNYLERLGYRIYHFDKHGRIAGLSQKPADFSRAQNLIAIKGYKLPE